VWSEVQLKSHKHRHVLQLDQDRYTQLQPSVECVAAGMSSMKTGSTVNSRWIHPVAAQCKVSCGQVESELHVKSHQ